METGVSFFIMWAQLRAPETPRVSQQSIVLRGLRGSLIGLLLCRGTLVFTDSNTLQKNDELLGSKTLRLSEFELHI